MNADRLRLSSFKLVAYAPQYVADAAGLFESEGLSLELEGHTGDWSGLLQELAAGRCDIVVGNLWFAMQEWCSPGVLVPIAHCVQQCGSILVRRRIQSQSPEFRWDDLHEKSIALQSDVPTPWVAFRTCLLERGITLERVKVLIGLSTSDITDALRSGSIDYALTHIERAQTPGIEEVASIAAAVGPVPWSVFFAERHRLARDPDPFLRFRNAITRAMNWIHARAPGEIAASIGARFSELHSGDLNAVIDRYVRLAAWPDGVEISTVEADRWQAMLLDSGLLRNPVDLEELLRFSRV